MTSYVKRKCAKCGKTRADDLTVSFHRFPTAGESNIAKASAWARFCWPDQEFSSEKLQAIHKSCKVLCGRHFKSIDFYDDKRQKLSKYAVPAAEENTHVVQEAEKRQPCSNLSYSKKDNSGAGDNNNKIPENDSLSTSEIPSLSLEEPTSPNSKPELPSTSLKQQKIPENYSLLTSEIPSLSLEEPTSPNSKPELPSTSLDQQNKVAEEKKYTDIFKYVNTKKILELNESDRFKYDLSRQYIKEINRLRCEVMINKNINIIGSLQENESLENLLELNISSPLALLLQSELSLKKPKHRKYNMDDKIQALSLFKRSPPCYRLLRRMFSLPSQKTLQSLIDRVPLNAGINAHVFASLKEMAETQAEYDNIAILSFGEMPIREHIQYNDLEDHLDGFQDYGDQGRCGQYASNALVFMLAGISKSWKQPIAFYFTGNAFTSDRLSFIIKQVLTECFGTGLKIMATVCDMSRINIEALENLGSSDDNPYISLQGHEIVTIYDPSYLIRCTRDLFMKYDAECIIDVEPSGIIITGIAQWNHLCTFYNIDKDGRYVFAPILTEKHLNPNSEEKMRVTLAVDVFSHSVACGLMARIALGELPTEVLATAMMVSKFDDLLEALDADIPDWQPGKKFSTNMKPSSKHLKCFNYMHDYITNIHFLDVQSTPSCQVGWLHTLKAVMRLWKNLNAMRIRRLRTRRLKKDPLENCFSSICYHCGSNDVPTVTQFISGIKAAILSNLAHRTRKPNCQKDKGVLSNNLRSFLMSDENKTENTVPIPPLINFNYDELQADVFYIVEKAAPELQACTYVCGFIFKMIQYYCCQDCLKSFSSNTSSIIHIFSNYKKYNHLRSSLKYVNRNYIDCIKSCATIVIKLLDIVSWTDNLKKKTLAMVSSVVKFDFIECNAHRDVMIDHLITSVLFTVLKIYTTKINRELLEAEKAKYLQ